jgi:hypothetical protein
VNRDFPQFHQIHRQLSALLLVSFQSFENGPPLAPVVAERDVTYRLETDDSMMFSDVRKVSLR